MKIKKTVSALCALAMAVTAFAGLAVTANAQTVNATLVHTASYNVDFNDSSVDVSAGTYTVDQETEVIHMYSSPNYTAVGYAEFDISDIPDNATVTSATLTYYAANYSKNNRTVKLKYVTDTTGIDLTKLTGTISNLSADIAKSGNIGIKTPTKVEANVKAAIDGANGDRVIFAFGDMNNGGYLYGKGSEEYAPTLTVEATTAQTYAVKFAENSGADITVMMGDEDVTKGTLLTAGHYTYTAIAEGYHPYSGEFDVTNAPVNVTFSMEPIPEAPEKVLPENAIDTTTVTASKTGNANSEFVGYDTRGEGYTWYATMDFYLTEGGAIRYLGKTNRNTFTSAGESTSIVFSTDEVRYYTSSGGTWIGDGLEPGKWYTVILSSDLTVPMGNADSGNTLSCVITETETGKKVLEQSGIGLRNAGSGFRYVSVDDAKNGSVADNFYSYFIEDEKPVPEQVTAEQVTVEGYDDVKAFAVKDVTLNGNTPTWTITAKKGDNEQKYEEKANIPTVEAGNVNLGLIVNNVPEDVTVSATLGYTK